MDTVMLDPLVRIKASDGLIGLIQLLAEECSSDLPSNLEEILKDASKLLTVQDIRWIFEHLGDRYHLHELIEQSEVILPQPKLPPRNPELEKRIQRLKAEEAEREYKRMTENIDGRQGLAKQSLDEPISKQMKELNNYLVIILQFVVSVVCSFVFGFMAPYYFNGVINTGTRLLTGIMCAFIVAIADLYFVVKFMLEAEGLIQPNNIKVYDSQFPQKGLKID